MQLLRHLLIWFVVIVAASVAVLLLFGPRRPAEGAIDCGTTYRLRVEIKDSDHPELNSGLLALPGAYVHFNRHPQAGSTTGVDYIDNGTLDDDRDRLGAIEERTACRATASDDYAVQLKFLSGLLKCDILGQDTQLTSLTNDTTLEFAVDDCKPVDPSPTPTATPLPPTATPTLVPTATSTPAPTSTATALPATPVVIVIRLDPPTPAPTPVVVQPVVPSIRPPATGSAGLLP